MYSYHSCFEKPSIVYLALVGMAIFVREGKGLKRNSKYPECILWCFVVFFARFQVRGKCVFRLPPYLLTY